MDIRVLVVEDNVDHAETLKRVLQSRKEAHYEVTCVGTLADALEVLHKICMDAVLLDLTLPDARGTVVVEEIAKASQNVGIVVLTGWGGDPTLEKSAKDSGANTLLTKPAEPDQLSLELQYAVLDKKHTQEKHKIEESLAHIGKLVDKIGEIPVDGIKESLETISNFVEEKIDGDKK